MRPTLACVLLLTLAACNPAPPLSTADKAKFVYELIEGYRDCDTYRQRLSAPAVEAPAIDAVYKEAVKTGCIKRDV